MNVAITTNPAASKNARELVRPAIDVVLEEQRTMKVADVPTAQTAQIWNIQIRSVGLADQILRRLGGGATSTNASGWIEGTYRISKDQVLAKLRQIEPVRTYGG